MSNGGEQPLLGMRNDTGRNQFLFAACQGSFTSFQEHFQLVVAGPAASQEDAYVCTACERGYEGNKCEV